jgi:transposase
LTGLLTKPAPNAERIGFETGAMVSWLPHELRRVDVPVVDARHAHAVLANCLRNSDQNDARGLAELTSAGIGKRNQERRDSTGPRYSYGATWIRRDIENQVRSIIGEYSLLFSIALGFQFRKQIIEFK